MKKVLNAFKNLGFEILGIILVIILGVFLILMLPFDYIKYKRSLYYKTEHKKYTLFAASGFAFDLYNEILKHNLPIKYIHNPNNDDLGCGWFVYNSTLIILNVLDFEYDTKNNTWAFCCEDPEEETTEARSIMTLDEYIETSIADANKLAGKTICDNAVVLIEADMFDDPELAKQEKRFVIYDDNLAEALKAFCDKNI